MGFEPQQVSLVEQTPFPPIQPGTAALSCPALQLLSPVQVQVPTTMRSLTETRPRQMVHRLTHLSPQPDAPSIWEQSPSSPITQCAWSGHISDGQNDNLRLSVASDTRHALFVRRWALSPAHLLACIPRWQSLIQARTHTPSHTQ